MIALVLAAIFVAAEAQPLDAFLKSFEQKREHVNSLHATFKQEIVGPDGSEELTGAILYVKPKRIVFRYDDPADALIVDDTNVYEYWTDIEQVNIHSLKDQPQAEALFLGFGGDLSQLAEAYTIEHVSAPEENCGTEVVTLTPKEPDPDARLFERVRLFLRKDDLLPCKILIVNSAESQVVYHITEIAANKPFEPAATQLDVPVGWKIVESEMPVQTVGEGGMKLPQASEPPKPPAP